MPVYGFAYFFVVLQLLSYLSVHYNSGIRFVNYVHTFFQRWISIFEDRSRNICCLFCHNMQNHPIFQLLMHCHMRLWY